MAEKYLSETSLVKQSLNQTWYLVPKIKIFMWYSDMPVRNIKNVLRIRVVRWK